MTPTPFGVPVEPDVYITYDEIVRLVHRLAGSTSDPAPELSADASSSTTASVSRRSRASLSPTLGFGRAGHSALRSR